FTLFYDPAGVSPAIRARRVRTSFLNPLRCCYRSVLPLMPIALEQLDLRGYDLIVSSESGPAKGVLVPSGARHVCYVHSPMRYLWELYPEYAGRAPRWKRALMAPASHYLRLWDTYTAARVDEFIANSENVRARIRRAWGRESRVIHPPVPVETFFTKPPEDWYLIVSELVDYKRIDVAIRAFSRSGRRLRIAGQGPEYRRLRAMASSNVEFCGHVPDAELRELYARCRAFLMPGEEDFGMTMVEALASGKPVIALARGGAAEIVEPDCGVLYEEGEGLDGALTRFEARSFSAERCQASAQRYSEKVFVERMRSVLFQHS
ncbi:MAG: glycosyltransferase, partial [Bryobacteraceae bacterium]